MDYQQFPGCCGAYILKNFGGTDLSNYATTHTASEIKNFLTSTETNLKRYRYAFMLATINHDQYAKYKKAFSEAGWRCMKKEYHYNHASTIYLMFKSLN